jgi:gliding motility-associated-like protein
LLASIIGSNVLQAQLCTGSLGDPVVNITFGSGSGNTGYVPTNAYTYTNSPCPNDGYYTITGSTSNCFNSSWHTLNNDHTGNGAFLLVNASFAPGDFMVTKVSGLCPNTTYEFAAWMVNVLVRSGIKPNISFSIESTTGTILKKFTTGDIAETPTPEWKQYGFFFITPPTDTEIILRMTNNAPGGVGNDIGLDDITFRPCGPNISSTIQGYGDTASSCEGQPNAYTFNASVSAGFAVPIYQWQQSLDNGSSWQDISGANTPTYNRPGTGTGIYKYRLTVTEQSAAGINACRIASNNLTIIVYPNPIVDAGPDRTVLAGDAVTLYPTITTTNPTFNWTPPTYLSSANMLNPAANPPLDQVYTLNVTSAYGCRGKDDVKIFVAADIFIPTAFTPNNDGLNDHWRIPYLDPQLNATVSVYNRYGQMVYRVVATTVDWDGQFNGQDQPNGTYVYNITFANNIRKPMKGSFTLIR